MMGRIKKRTAFCAPLAKELLMSLSKAALADMCSNLALLGTNETDDEVLTRLAREAGRRG
jgi:hypothetical protein